MNKNAVEFVELLLYYLDKNTDILDLCDIIGIDFLVEILEIMGGTSIKMPSSKILKAPGELKTLFETNSLIHEFYDIVGKENVIKAIKVFDNRTVRVPSIRILKMAVRDIDVYHYLNLSYSLNRKKYLAKKYNMTIKTVEGLYRKVQNLFNKDKTIINYLKELGLYTQARKSTVDYGGILSSEIDDKNVIIKDMEKLDEHYDEIPKY